MRASYHDIKAEILSRIRKNTWPPGANLPGEIALAEEFGCARATVNRAMRELVDEGILERKRKAGTRVKLTPSRKAEFRIPLIREEISATGAQYRYALVSREIIEAPVWLRAQIGVQKGQGVAHIKCMHYAGSSPYQFEERWINLGVVPDAETYDFEVLGPNEWLVHKVPLTEGEVVFSATKADAELAEFLSTEDGEAIFTIERTTWLEGASVTYARLHFARDYKMTSRL